MEDAVTLTLTREEARQMKAILVIVRNKTQRGPFWARFFVTVSSVLERLTGVS